MAPKLEEVGGMLRLPISEILADHATCVRWAAMGRALRREATPYQDDRAQRIASLLAPHKDVIEAAQRCVAGRGHH